MVSVMSTLSAVGLDEVWWLATSAPEAIGERRQALPGTPNASSADLTAGGGASAALAPYTAIDFVPRDA